MADIYITQTARRVANHNFFTRYSIYVSIFPILQAQHRLYFLFFSCIHYYVSS